MRARIINKMSPLLFSVIIPTCNRNKALGLCLERLGPAQQENMTLIAPENTDASKTPYTYEVLIIDDSPNARACPFAQEHFPWARWEAGPKKGPAFNRNQGAKSACGEWLIFTDDDCLPQKQWLWQFAQALQSVECYALEGSILPDGDPNADLSVCPINHTGGNFWAANIAIKKTLFHTVGGFDEQFLRPKLEDSDLYLRLKEKTTIPFVKEALVLHPVQQLSLIQACKKEYLDLPSHAYFLAKHYKSRTLSILKKEYLHWLCYCYRCLKNNHWGSVCLSIWMLFFGIPKIIILFKQYRQKIQ